MIGIHCVGSYCCIICIEVEIAVLCVRKVVNKIIKKDWSKDRALWNTGLYVVCVRIGVSDPYLETSISEKRLNKQHQIGWKSVSNHFVD